MCGLKPGLGKNCNSQVCHMELVLSASLQHIKKRCCVVVKLPVTGKPFRDSLGCSAAGQMRIVQDDTLSLKYKISSRVMAYSMKLSFV